MKNTSKLLAMSLLAAGFLTACPKGEEPAAEVKVEVPEVVKEVVKEEVKEPVKEEVKVDEAMYLKAAFETTCVKAHINDAEKLKETLAEVYARYGYDEAKFGDAQKAMMENVSTTTALGEKMKLCTKEIAGQLKEKSSEDLMKAEVKADDTKADGEKVVKKAPAVVYTGKYKANVSATGFTGTAMSITVKKDNKVLASFKGKREGKLFSLILRGEVKKGGVFTATGKKGTATASITGTIKKGSAVGSVSGSINKKPYNTRFNAKK